MSIKERFYDKLNEAREQLDEVSKELAKRAEHKAAKKFYDKYDSTTDLRKKAIKSKDKKDIEAAKEEEGKMHKAGKQAAKFQKYAAKKKMNEEEQLDEVSRKTLGNYIKKAHKNTNKLTLTLDNPKAPKEYARQAERKFRNRNKGIERAADKLAK